MEHRNLYAPPAAAVADPVGIRATRPKEITWAIILIWVWAATYLTSVLPPMAAEFLNGGLSIFFILGWLIVPIGIPALIVAWITDRIGAGRRWARILACLLIGIYLVNTLRQWPVLLHPITGIQPLSSLSNLVWISLLARLTLAVGTMTLLFTPRANQWFKEAE
jgi:MFS family permease